MFPVRTDTWTAGFNATTATINRITAPTRSGHGARLKNIHQTTMPAAASMPANIAISTIGSEKISPSGEKAGMTYRPSTSRIAKATPGQSRIGFREVSVLVCI
jgi:hypothetical protein